MVIVRLIGGLGNQMFQYALGRTLSQRHAVPLKLDISGYGEYTLHGYCLNRLRIKEVIADEGEISRLRGRGSRARILRLLARAGFGTRRVLERGFQFQPAVLDVRPPLYLEGYWQSEKYFASAAGVLREEFALREPMDEANRAMADLIGSCDSVAVHVRRGDYVSNAETNAVHGVCGDDYYAAASKIIMQRIARPHAFVFSDDIGWTRQHLALGMPTTYVDLNPSSRNHLDLHLMAACRHQIIANSSFSWWAAWLNDNPGKTVVAPRRWFRKEDIDTRDLLPAAWLTT